MTAVLRRETCHSPEDQRNFDAGERLWQQPELHGAETAELAFWVLARHAPVLSAVMARIHLLWEHWRNDAELDISPATGLPQLSWWAGPGTDELARLLVGAAIEVEGPGGCTAKEIRSSSPWTAPGWSSGDLTGTDPSAQPVLAAARHPIPTSSGTKSSVMRPVTRAPPA